ncbi:uncharacterized protein LOC113272825 [Papaver somniferum]|uniref:uncharacterized protein LOC113272825 n=1 Tax=Papaver somniferum TaxID=3469 RepID=UPI000E6F8244|nr:uncharacterized protein LOC113272825 [Papaver somniferum]
MVSAVANNARQVQGEHAQNLARAGVDLNNLPVLQGGTDTRVWMPDLNGKFNVRSAKQLVRKQYPVLEVYGLLWRKAIHPKLALDNWKIIREACATSDKVRSRFKIELANRCYLCKAEEESLEHILWSYSYATHIWEWISGIFNLRPYYDIVTGYKSAKGRSRIVKDLWLLSILVIRSELWQTRNLGYFENKTVTIHFFKQRIFHLIHDYSVRLKSFMHNTTSDLEILNFFRVKHREVKQTMPVECFWIPPGRDELLLCCDGAAKENPGVAGAGVIARDHDCNFVGAMSIGLGRTTNFLAEIYVVIVGLEWARKWDFRRILIRSDSMGAIKAFSDSNIPWFARKRWRSIQQSYNSIRFVHTYREAKFVVDSMSKRGCLLRNGEGLNYDERPYFLYSLEFPDVCYFRFN